MLCAPFAWMLILGLLRGQFDIDQLDEYFRHVIAAGVLLALYGKVKSVHWAWFKALTSLSAITLLVMIILGFERWNWDQRYATYFVDPNSLGIAGFVQGAVLGLALIQNGLWADDSKSFRLPVAAWVSLLALGTASGWAVSVMSGTRGVWLALIPLFFVLITVSKRPLSVLGISLIFSAILVLLASQSTFLQKRYDDAVRDVDLWMHTAQKDTPVGIRLSIYQSLYQLASEKPWLGMHPQERDQKFQTLPSLSPVAKYTLMESGAHNQYLEKQILNGLPGSFLALMLYLLPLLYFWRVWRKAESDHLKFACSLGVVVCLCYLVSGLSLVLTLKYLNSYWAACVILAATAIPSKSNGAPHV
ncbi:MAG: O-antigen ligase family protein [Limnobacter sp.]|nr:O-antigen ligase family protein [Limnobacter sp.]